MKTNPKVKIFIAILFLFTVIPYFADLSEELGERLRGRILLEAQKSGEAWYVDPDSRSRIYLSRPAEALEVMKEYGLGVGHADLLRFREQGFPDKLAGKILLDVENSGEAYYVNPEDLEGHYLGRPADAFRIMKRLGLGITEENIEKIPVKDTSSRPRQTGDSIEGGKYMEYEWQYKGDEYSVGVELFESAYDHFRNRSRTIMYTGEDEDWQKEYFELYLSREEGMQQALDRIVADIEKEVARRDLGEDGAAELALAFVQSIPYDQELAEKILNEEEDAYMKYPYEVLYENKGTCGGKSFLAVLLFEELGYGTALFEFEEDNHLAPAIQCEQRHSNYNSGYCFSETTIERYPIGIMPESNPLSSEVSDETAEEGETGTLDVGSLERGKIRRKTEGDMYTSMEKNIERVDAVNELKQEIGEQQDALEAQKKELDALQGELKELKEQLEEYEENEEYEKYNELLPEYNSKVKDAKEKADEYNHLIKAYNTKVKEFNSLVKELQ